MKNNLCCPLCLSTQSKLKWKSSSKDISEINTIYNCTTKVRNRPAVYECSKCNHQFTDFLQKQREIISEYEELVDIDYLKLETVKTKTFKLAFDRLFPFLDGESKLLEVGSYLGFFLEIANKNGIRTTGVEPSKWAVEKCRQRNLNVIQGDFTKVASSITKEFDVVVSWDVIEHVFDPIEFFALLSSKVKNGGVVAISTLDRSNFLPRLLRSKWPWIIPMHLHYFDRQSVIKLGENAGCQLIASGSHIHFANLEYVISKFPLINKLISSSNLRTWLRNIILPFSFGDVRYFIFRKNNDYDL